MCEKLCSRQMEFALHVSECKAHYMNQIRKAKQNENEMKADIFFRYALQQNTRHPLTHRL